MEEKEIQMNEIEVEAENCEHGIAISSPDELAIVMTVPLDKENLEDCKYNAESFQAGVDEYSSIAGEITALINAGLTPELPLGYIVNMETAIMTKEMNIEMAKHGAIAKDKSEM